ncbi:hypothetical protein ACR77J_07890 [Tissierella praeacuta]|uniref:hypothetical protein n=1 Tax=Tissierella praeacuta TaxID=43131 RepID=UPI003DA66053
MINIGENVVIRDWNTFLNGAKNSQSRQYLIFKIRQLVETQGLILISIERVSKQKWQVMEVVTEENSYYLDDEDFYLKADIYDTKKLLNAKPTKYYNDFLGEMEENRVS